MEVLAPLATVCSALATGLATFVAAAVPAVGAVLGFALMAAFAVDPMLIAVTPEGEWIEIDRWAA